VPIFSDLQLFGHLARRVVDGARMTLLWVIVSLVLVGVILTIIAVLFYGLFGSVLELRKARMEARRYRSARQWALYDLDHSQVKRRLLNHEYFSPLLRATPTLQDFLYQVDKGDHVSLDCRYPRKKLYHLLVKAEREAGIKGRPQALNHIDEISDLLYTLARKAKEAAD
jgi:hypothetical protein